MPITNNRTRILAWTLAAVAVLVSLPGVHAAGDSAVPVEEMTLPNGMKFLLVQRPEMTTVSTGWVARVGSANEKPGITGLSHLFEHMMFKGTHTIGTSDIKRDLEIIAEQEQIQEQIRAMYREQQRRWRLGEVKDPFDPAERPAALVELEAKFQQLVEDQRAVMVKDEFDKIYTEAGASGMNAGTNRDLTFYFITVPANKLELWFWMESDRLMNPVNREFYSERDVVHEERRLRTESTPTGKFDEQFEAMFWESHPYSWPVVGWPSDLRMISKAQADEYYATFYAPNNLTAALVGNFDSAEVKALAERYFGRLKRAPRDAPAVITLEMEQLAEKRMLAECDCQPQTEVRYHTVPFMHVDSYALDVLSELLNGRTGRLYKSMVLDTEIATSAFASQNSQKWAGYFSAFAEAKGETSPAQLEAALNAELDRLKKEPIPDMELQKVKNQITADAFRRLESPFYLMLQLLLYDGYGDWNYLNAWDEKTLAVTAEDVKRVAEKYFTRENRAVAHYLRKAGTAEEALPEGFDQLEPQQQQMVKGMIARLKQIEDVAQLEEALTQIDQQKAQAPPQFTGALLVIEKWLKQRVESMKSEGGE